MQNSIRFIYLADETKRIKEQRNRGTLTANHTFTPFCQLFSQLRCPFIAPLSVDVCERSVRVRLCVFTVSTVAVSNWGVIWGGFIRIANNGRIVASAPVTKHNRSAQTGKQSRAVCQAFGSFEDTHWSCQFAVCLHCSSMRLLGAIDAGMLSVEPHPEISQLTSCHTSGPQWSSGAGLCQWRPWKKWN